MDRYGTTDIKYILRVLIKYQIYSITPMEMSYRLFELNATENPRRTYRKSHLQRFIVLLYFQTGWTHSWLFLILIKRTPKLDLGQDVITNFTSNSVIFRWAPTSIRWNVQPSFRLLFVCFFRKNSKYVN